MNMTVQVCKMIGHAPQDAQAESGPVVDVGMPEGHHAVLLEIPEWSWGVYHAESGLALSRYFEDKEDAIAWAIRNVKKEAGMMEIHVAEGVRHGELYRRRLWQDAEDQACAS
jgi:hypothetical protein